MRPKNTLGLAASVAILAIFAAIALVSQPGSANDNDRLSEYHLLTAAEMVKHIGGANDETYVWPAKQEDDFSHGLSSSDCEGLNQQQCSEAETGWLQYKWHECTSCTGYAGRNEAIRNYTYHYVDHRCGWVDYSCQLVKTFSQYGDDCNWMDIVVCTTS